MKRITFLLFLFAASLITLPQLAFAGAFETDRQPVAIFKAVCASCHGYDGTGNNGGFVSWVDETPAFDIQGASANKVTNFVRGGRGLVMPGFNREEISDTELTALANCIHDGTCVGQPDPASQATVWVQDEPPWFQPYVLNVAVGNTVKFINRGQTWHTVTQGDFLVAANPASGQTNSGMIGRGGKYFRTFSTSGATNFYCMLHPFMQMQVCAGITCSAPTVTDPTPLPPPSVPGVGELWVAAQFQNLSAAGKPVDTGVTAPNNPPFPELAVTFDDFVKPGEIQVIDLTNYSITRAPTPANNPFNNPHYIWGRAGATEMSIDNYFDNYKSFLNGSTKAVTLARLTWGTTASHTTSEFDGSPLVGPVQGDYAIQNLRPGSKIGTWSVGSSTRITSTDANGHTGSMPHGIWAGGTNGTKIETANSRSNNATIFSGNNQATCTMGAFPLNSGITTTGSTFAATDIGNPTTFSTALAIRTGSSGANCGTTLQVISLPGEGAVQTPPSPDDRFLAVSNGPYISVFDLVNNFSVGASNACVGGTFTTDPGSGRKFCSINSNSFGAHGVAWGRRGDTQTGWRIYMAAKLTNFVAVFDLITNPDGSASVSHPGDIALIKEPTATAINAFAGVATTGGQGLTTRPLPTPWQ